MGVGVVGSSYIVRRTYWMPAKCCRHAAAAAAASDPQMGKKPRLTLEEVPFGARSYLHCQCTVECLLTGGGGGDTGWSTTNNIPILTYDSIAQMPQKAFFIWLTPMPRPVFHVRASDPPRYSRVRFLAASVLIVARNRTCAVRWCAEQPFYDVA